MSTTHSQLVSYGSHQTRCRVQSVHNKIEEFDKAIRKPEPNGIARNTVPYRIKILNRRTECCTLCGRYTRIDGQVDSSQNNYYNFYRCQGCTAKDSLPIGLQFDLKKVYFSLDWNETLAFNTAAVRPIQHPSFVDTHRLQSEQKNTLGECFQLYAQSESGIELRCEKCQHTESCLLTRVNKSPNLLIVHLKRFKYSGGYLEKLLNRVEVPFDVSLNSISDSAQPDNKYELYAVACHRGSGFAGHYFSYVFKNRKSWVKCDDDTTEIVDFGSINLTDVYLLFYRKLNMSSSLLAL